MFPLGSFEDYAAAAVERLEACCGSIRAPFIHSFPQNCCELISVHLGITLEKKKYHDKVQVVKAYNSHSDESHFWLEVDNLVLDLTAHQFGQYSGPLVCPKPSPLEIFFPDIERISPKEAKDAANFDINYQIEDILAVFAR